MTVAYIKYEQYSLYSPWATSGDLLSLLLHMPCLTLLVNCMVCGVALVSHCIYYAVTLLSWLLLLVPSHSRSFFIPLRLFPSTTQYPRPLL